MDLAQNGQIPREGVSQRGALSFLTPTPHSYPDAARHWELQPGQRGLHAERSQRHDGSAL